MSTLVKYTAWTVSAGVAVAVVLVLFGLRVVRDGSGTPRLRFLASEEAMSREIERHHASQQNAPHRQEVLPSADASRQPDPRSDGTTGVTSAARAGATDGSSGGIVTPSASEPTSAAGADDWPGFRGPHRDGRYPAPVALSWPAGGPKPLWRQPIGGGYASFAMAANRAFTIEQRLAQEVVSAYDVDSGRQLWQHAWDGEFREFLGGDGPRATPTWSDDRVFALGALGELRALDATTGKLIWRHNILEDNGATNLQWGMAASPLVFDGKVVVLPGGSNGRSVVAYDAATGARRWSVLDDKQAYVSPMLVELAGRRQLLVVSASRMVGLAPDDGVLLWEFPWVTEYDINAAQPLIVGDHRVFISSGYGHGAALLELSGTDGGRIEVRAVWQTNRMKNRFNSSVLHDGHIYGLDEGILACVDVDRGELKWKAGRYGYGQVLLAGERLIVLTEDGDLALVRPTPERLDELVRFPVLDGKTWNYPALARGRLLVRNLREMAAFDLRPQ